MAELLGGNQIKLNSGKVITAKEGEWHDGRRFLNGQLLSPGEYEPGKFTSQEVNLQSDKAQGNQAGDIEKYLASQRQKISGSPQQVPSSGYSNFPTTTSGAGAGTGSLEIPQAPTIDLQQEYKSLYDSSGISDLEKELADKERAFTEAKGLNNDNPFLSEASRVGREAKLNELYDNRTKNLRDEIATKKADIETQLNLSLKQFDINSQQAQEGLSRLNTLLSLGALDNASGEQIAQLTRSTGISSEMINSAINSRKQSSIETQVITSTADNGVVTATVINPQTGDIIKQTSLGAIGNQQGGGSSSTKINEYEVKNELVSDIRNGKGVRDVFAIYSDLLDPNDILRIYNSNSPYGPAKESQQELQLLGVDAEKFYGSSEKF